MSTYINPVEQLVHSTLRIECETEHGLSSGSAYYFVFLAKEDTSVPCIATNKKGEAISQDTSTLENPSVVQAIGNTVNG